MPAFSRKSRLVRAPDDTFDFYFHITTSSSSLKGFRFNWQALASYTVAYHATDPELLWIGEGPSSPAPGSSESDVRRASAFWCWRRRSGN
jgi:hypothetical protein